jgi:hypothetical protein
LLLDEPRSIGEICWSVEKSNLSLSTHLIWEARSLDPTQKRLAAIITSLDFLKLLGDCWLQRVNTGFFSLYRDLRRMALT